jgi:hypothetical protein
MKSLLLSLCLGGVVSLSSQAKAALSYPTKPIRIVVGFAAGGPGDLFARLIGQFLNAAWGQPVVVDLRPGATGNIGADVVAKSSPDGYTLYLPSFSIAVNPSLYKNLSYNLISDFSPVCQFAEAAHVIVLHPNVPAKTLQQLLQLIRKEPRGLNFASAGNGTSSHLAGELVNMMAGVKLNHIPYKGMSPAHNDVIGGQVPLIFDNVSTALGAIKSGRLRAIAVSSAQRQPQLPEVPTLSESGIPGYEITAWYGLLAPAQTSELIVNQLHQQISQSLKEPATRERVNLLGAEVADKNPAAFQAHLKSEMTKWGKVVKAAAIKLD